MYLPFYNRWIRILKTGDSWRCLRCGECCRSYAVELNESDLRKLSEEWIETLEDGRKRLKRREDGACIFYDEETRSCRIYEKRPDSCRVFPFSILKRETAEMIGLKFEEEDLVEYRRKQFLVVCDDLCSGLNAGGKVKRVKIVKECFEIAERFGFRF